MREIRFRGFSVTDKKWVYGKVIEKDGAYWILEKAIGMYSESKRNNVYDGLGGRFRFELHHVYKESVGQYVWLRDVNNKEVYEGDVVRCKRKFYCNGSQEEEFIARVVFKDREFKYELLKWVKKSDCSNWHLCAIFEEDEIEVIGNTFEK